MASIGDDGLSTAAAEGFFFSKCSVESKPVPVRPSWIVVGYYLSIALPLWSSASKVVDVMPKLSFLPNSSLR